MIIFNHEYSLILDIGDRNKTFLTNGAKGFIGRLQAHHAMPVTNFGMGNLQALLPGIIAETGADHALAFHFSMAIVGIGQSIIKVFDPGVEITQFTCQVVTGLCHVDENIFFFMLMTFFLVIFVMVFLMMFAM